jgi:2-polyprenyl-3-methyl-5-hydroxy-6-metoxy-1,4-benzoquinol methylase
MSDAATGAPAADRGTWLRNLRRVNEQQEDALAGDFDAQWGEIEPTHQAFVERYLSRLPPAGRVLDAACGTGKYFPMVLASGRGLLGVDHAGAYLAVAATKFPQIPTEQHDLQELSYQGEFDGVLCMDAMEFVPPEDWPPVLERFRRALRPGGWLYLTIELAPADRVRAANQAARRSGLPVVDGELIWEGPDGYYHHYPSMGQVRVWLASAGFTLDEEAEAPWHEEGYAYHHVLARVAAPPG